MFALLMGLAMTWIFSRGEIRRTVRSTATTADKVDRLYKSAGIPVQMTMIFGLATAGELLYEVPALRHWWWVCGVAVVYAFHLAAIAVWSQALLPALWTLRAEPPSHGGVSDVLRAAAVVLVPWYLWVTILGILLSRSATGLELALAFTTYVVLSGVISPVLIRLAYPTRHPTEWERRRIQTASDAFGLDVGAVRLLGGPLGTTVNAMAAGLGPSGKRIFATERLLAVVNDEELAAVLAHEVGHREEHHALIWVAAHVSVTVAMVAAGITVLRSQQLEGLGMFVALIVLLVTMPEIRRLALGAVSRRLEHRADHFAAERVGTGAMHRALVRIADADDEPTRRTLLDRLTSGHPDIQSRLERLPNVRPSR